MDMVDFEGEGAIMKFSELVENMEKNWNGHVLFMTLDSENNIIGEYERECYNEDDEECIRIIKQYSNCLVRIASVEENLHWLKVTCVVVTQEEKFDNDIITFVQEKLNKHNKYHLGGCYLYENTPKLKEYKIVFHANQKDGYKKLLAFLATTDYILVKTDLCTYSVVIRHYK